jgi:hypothetical protein
LMGLCFSIKHLLDCALSCWFIIVDIDLGLEHNVAFICFWAWITVTCTV